MSLEQAPGLPRFRAVERELTRRILQREYVAGEKLPSEAQLVAALGVSRQTVSKALSELAKQGLVSRNKRAGTVVTNHFHERFVLPLYDISADITQRGDIYSFSLIGRNSMRNADQGFAWAELESGASVLELELVHFANAIPVAHERRYINVEAAPSAFEQDFAQIAPSTWLLDNVPWSTVRHRITALNCPPTMAGTLQVPDGTACVVVERRTWHLDVPVTIARMTLAGDRLDISGEYSLATL